MSEQDKPFVVNDRRKFRMDGELREPHAPAETPQEAAPASGPIPIDSAHTNSAHLVTPAPEEALSPGPSLVTDAPAANDASDLANADTEQESRPDMPPPPTAEEMEQVRLAYEQTSERLDTMMRATNPGGEHLPPMDFTRLVQSIYMSAMVQLGAGAEPGQQARVDLIGAKQSADMLGVIEEKTRLSRTEQESRLIESALFELRLGFLEITQILARQAAARQPGPGAPGGIPGGPTGAGGFGGGGFTGAGPRIVR